MHVIKMVPKTLELELDYYELMGLKNALVAAVHHMDDVDLHSRIGLHRAEARALLDSLLACTREMWAHHPDNRSADTAV